MPRQRKYYRSYCCLVKTAISLPDDLSRQIDARARALKLSRSALLARAAREFLSREPPLEDPTEAWNKAIARGGQPGDDPAAVAARRRTKEVVRSAAKARR
jgi:predicted transcriptional regulator